MKYYIVIGHKKGEMNDDYRSYTSNSIELIERDEEHGQLDGGYEIPGAHQSFGYLDMNFNEGAQYGARASLTQEAWLIGRHRIARMVDFGNFGYKFVRYEGTTRIQFPDKITLSFDKAIPVDGDKRPRRPSDDSQRVNIELTNPTEQIINCYDKECTIDPKVFQLAQFDNYGDVYLDIQQLAKYQDFKANFVHFVYFMKNYPNSNLFLVCSQDKENEIKELLKGAIVAHHLTNYIEFCNNNFSRKSSYGKQSGEPHSEYDTFRETIKEFFNENTFNSDKATNERNFYSVPFKNAKITIDASYSWERYTKSIKFQNFLKHNPNIALEISGNVTSRDVVEFISTHKIKATLFLSNDPNNADIIKALTKNRQEEIQAQLDKHQYGQLLLREEQVAPPPELRLTVRKYLARQAGLDGATEVHDEVNAMGQNQNTQQQQQQQMVTSSNAYYEPVKLEISSKSSIPDVAFETNDELLQQLIGLKFTDHANAPQIEAHIKQLFGTMQTIIRKSAASQDCYCPLSYSVEELLPGAFYVPRDKISTVDHPRTDFDTNKNTLFFSPPYASIAIKKDKYAFKPFNRPMNKELSPSDVLSDAIKQDKFVKDLVRQYREDVIVSLEPQTPIVVPPPASVLDMEMLGTDAPIVASPAVLPAPVTEKQQIQALLNQLLLKRGEAGVKLFTRSLYSLQLKNPSIYDTLIHHYILTSSDLSEFIDNPGYVSTFLNLANLKDKKKIAWWNKIVAIQCKTNPNFDLNNLYKQFASFWEDIDKLQNFLTIPDEFPFDDFADAGITLGKMYRIMANTKNRFEQINNFRGGNISHAYMLFDLFNASMYCKEMDEYCTILTTQLKAEDAFNRSNLKETYFSLSKLNELATNPDVSLEQLKSYLFTYAAVNSNVQKQNNSDVGFYRALFAAIETEIASKDLSLEDKKILYSTIMLFASYGNNTSISNSEQDIRLFVNQPDVITTCRSILEQYNQPETLGNFFVEQESNGKMKNSEAMLSFHTVSLLMSKSWDNTQKIMSQAQAWIMNNKALSPALQKIMRESSSAAKSIAVFDRQPEYLKSLLRQEPNALIQSIFLIMVDLDTTITAHTADIFERYRRSLSACNATKLEQLNKLFLDINCERVSSSGCRLFTDRTEFERFLQNVQEKSTFDDLIFLAQDYKLPLKTIKPSKAGLLVKIKEIENTSTPTTHIARYNTVYREYLKAQLESKLGNIKEIDPFNDLIINKITISHFSQLKNCYESLNRIIETTKKDDLLKIMNLLKAFKIGSTDRDVNPVYLLQVTDLLLKHVSPIENIERFLNHVQQSSGDNAKINEKFRYLHCIFEKISQEPECYEGPSSKKKLSKKVVAQLKACMELLNVTPGENLIQLVQDNNNIQHYLQFLAVAASPTNISTPEFASNNAHWNTLNRTYPTAFSDLLDIAKFDIALLSAIQFSNIAQIRFVAKICRNESSLNLRMDEPLNAQYKQKFTQDLKSLLSKNLSLDVFYDDKQLSQPSIDSLLKLLTHYNNDVKKAHHHYEKDPGFNRPHKKASIATTQTVVNDKELQYQKTSFSAEKQNEAIDFITRQCSGIERSVRKNLLFKFSIYINDLGYKVRAFPHKGSRGQISMVPLRKLSDVELKSAFINVKNAIADFRNKGIDVIWENRTYQRNVCKLLAIIRESMSRYGNKNAYSTQMDAILLAVMAGDYSYAMQINTGEGKALITASIAVALQTLTNKQIVVTTSNMNLAERDAEAFDKFIQWFDIPHETISATTEDKRKLADAKIVHTTGADFALCHGKTKIIDNSNRIYLNDEGDYTMSHLTPAINSQSKPDELENWWIYEEILEYVSTMKRAELNKDSEQQTHDLITRLKDKFGAELIQLNTRKAQDLHKIQASAASEDDKSAAKLAVEERLNGPISTLMKRIAQLNKDTTHDSFSALIDSAIIAQYVFKRGSSYEIISHIEEGRKVNKVVPVEGGKPITDNDVMYMYGIHQFLIQKEILEFRREAEKCQAANRVFPHPLEFLQPPALESTTYFNNYSTQVGSKSIAFSGTIPKLKYQIYQSIMDEGRSHIIPHHKNNLRKDAVPYEQFANMKKGHNNVCKDENALIGKLATAIQAHDGPALVYCKDKNECEKRLEALRTTLASSGYTVQLIINGVTQDFTDGDKLTALGRQAQKKKTVTLTVGDGRGIDIKPEGQDGLLSICSFAPENVEKILQIYGRAARDGKVGKTNLFILENELKCYGKTFDNLEAKFEFLDKVRSREFNFAIKKIGFIQYEIQQKIKDETKRIEMIDFMDNLYNKLILKAVVANVKSSRRNRIGAYELQDRWEPFVMLSDSDLEAVYKDFCEKTQLELERQKLDNIDISQIDHTKEKYKQKAIQAKQKEINAQKGRSSAYIEERIQHAARKQSPRQPLDITISNPQDQSKYQQFELNLFRLDKTMSLMEQFVDGHIGVYGAKSNKSLSPEYKRICNTLAHYKQEIRDKKQEESRRFYQYLALQESLNAVNSMLQDPSKKSKRTQSAIERSLVNVDYCALNYYGSTHTIESVKRNIEAYCEQDSLDQQTTRELRDLQSTLIAEIGQYRPEDMQDITRECNQMYQRLQDTVNAQHQTDLETLATGPLDEVSDATTLYSMLHMATKEERNTAAVQAIIAPVSAEVNPSIEKYNALAHEFHAIVQEQLLCQCYLGLNSDETKSKVTEHEEMSTFNADSKTVFVHYQNKEKALKDIAPLTTKIVEEQAVLAQLKQAVSVQVAAKLAEYQRLFTQFEGIINEKIQCQTEQNLPIEPTNILDRYRALLTFNPNEGNIKRLRQLDFAISSLKHDITTENGLLAQLKNKPFYDKFLAKVALLEQKKEDFRDDGPKADPKAYQAVDRLHRELLRTGRAYFETPPTVQSYDAFKNACKESVDEARQELDHHRGWKKILANILAFILTAGIGYAIAAGINFAIHRKQTFWSTDSSLRIDKIEKCIDDDLPKPSGPTAG